jgi:hypothetical protein
MALTTEQQAMLNTNLDKGVVKKHPYKGFDYVEGHHAIREANRIFGFGGWQAHTETRMVVEREWKIKTKDPKVFIDGYLVCYTGHTTVRVQCEDGAWVERDGWGYGEGIDKNPGLAHEGAVKEAETDALKRALVKFGDPFGLALYDKEREHVDTGQPNGKPTAPPAEPAAPAFTVEGKTTTEIRDAIVTTKHLGAALMAAGFKRPDFDEAKRIGGFGEREWSEVGRAGLQRIYARAVGLEPGYNEDGQPAETDEESGDV